jgi:hypothetical protein
MAMRIFNGEMSSLLTPIAGNDEDVTGSAGQAGGTAPLVESRAGTPPTTIARVPFVRMWGAAQIVLNGLVFCGFFFVTSSCLSGMLYFGCRARPASAMASRRREA